MKDSARHRVLVAEDDAIMSEAICDRLTDAGYEVVARAESGAVAVEAALALRPDLILMDVRLEGDMDGIRASELINEKMRVPVIYLTGDSDHKTLQRAKAASAYGYVLKPFHIKNLIVAIEVAVDRFEMEQRLEDSQLTYATILGSIAEGVIAVDTQGRVRFMNGVAERLTGWSTREAQLEPLEAILDITDSAGDRPVVALTAGVLASRTTCSLGPDAFVTSCKGIQVPVDGGMSCVVDSLGRVVGASMTLRDVASARKAESDLRTMAEQLRAVVDTAVDGVLMFDAAGTVLMGNPACERLFGYSSAELTGRKLETIIPSSRLAAYGKPPRTTICRRRDRSTFPAEMSVGEAHTPGQPLFVGVIHDVSERRALEAAFLDAVGREQRRFATDLHDGLGQELTGLSLILSSLRTAAREAHSPHAPDLDQAQFIVQQALQSCRTIARGLSPIGPTEGGLVGALRDLVSRFKGPGMPSVEFSAGDDSRLHMSPAAADHLYRIAQEALANALKHANANAIKITLDIEPELVRLEIRDDGEGVKIMGADAAGLGLRTMQYRASLIGARFEIAPLQPNGTRVFCDCPATGPMAAADLYDGTGQ